MPKDVDGAVEPSSAEENASPEGEGDETGEGQMIPLSRFNQVNEERKQLLANQTTNQAELGELRTTLENLTKSLDQDQGNGEISGDTPLVGALPDVPEGMQGSEAAAFLINEALKSGGPKLIEQALGMPISEIRENLAAGKTANKSSAEVAYAQHCAPHGIDPEDQGARALFGVEMRNGGAGANAHEALKKVADRLNITPPSTGGAKVVTSGVGQVKFAQEKYPKDKKEASNMARQGLKVPDVDMHDIFAIGDRRRSGAQ